MAVPDAAIRQRGLPPQRTILKEQYDQFGTQNAIGVLVYLTLDSAEWIWSKGRRLVCDEIDFDIGYGNATDGDCIVSFVKEKIPVILGSRYRINTDASTKRNVLVFFSRFDPC